MNLTLGTTLWDVASHCETRDYTGADDDVTEAINCYLLAIKIYVSHQRYGTTEFLSFSQTSLVLIFLLGIAGQLYSEMGTYLAKMGNHTLAAEFTAQSAMLRHRDCMTHLHSFPEFSINFISCTAPMTAARLWYDTANLRISAKDFKSACECLNNCVKVSEVNSIEHWSIYESLVHTLIFSTL